MRFAGAQGWLRRACAALLAGMFASGALQAGWGIDLLERLPDFDVCWARGLFEISCPGCGMLRSLLRLGQLRLADATALHPLSLPSAVGIAWVAAGSPGRGRLRALPDAILGRAAALAIGVVVGVWALRIASGSPA